MQASSTPATSSVHIHDEGGSDDEGGDDTITEATPQKEEKEEREHVMAKPILPVRVHPHILYTHTHK